MFGCRTAFRVGCYVLGFGLAAACGGQAEHNNGAAGSAQGGANGKAGAASSSGGVGRGGLGGGTGGEPDSNLGDLEPVQSGCPMEDLPAPDFECDAFTAGSCGAGAVGCYPFVDHPEGSGCDQQRYGTQCLPAGRGTQGMLCGEEQNDWCAPGFVCVVGQRAGKRCAALCKLGAANSCNGGLICGDLDVAGFGVCG